MGFTGTERDLIFQIKTETGPICIVGVNMFVEVMTEKFHLGLQKGLGLSITGSEFAERAKVLDKTLYLGNFMFVHT